MKTADSTWGERQTSDAVLLERHANDRLYITPYIEITHDLQGTRFKVGFKHIEDQVSHGLMRNTLIAKTVEIEFQTLKLNNFLVRCVEYLYGRKIGIARSRTETGEFRV